MNLDWLHIAIGRAKWRCVVRERPRAWELEVEFRLIPVVGGSKHQSIAIGYQEQLPAADQAKDRREFVLSHFNKARQYLQNIVMEMGSTGIFNGERVRGAIPIQVCADPDRPDFDDRFALLEPADDEPGVWVLLDKTTWAQVEFMVPDDADEDARRKLIMDAMLRMHATNEAVARTRAHVAIPGRAARATTH